MGPPTAAVMARADLRLATSARRWRASHARDFKGSVMRESFGPCDLSDEGTRIIGTAIGKSSRTCSSGRSRLDDGQWKGLERHGDVLRRDVESVQRGRSVGQSRNAGTPRRRASKTSRRRHAPWTARSEPRAEPCNVVGQLGGSPRGLCRRCGRLKRRRRGEPSTNAWTRPRRRCHGSSR